MKKKSFGENKLITILWCVFGALALSAIGTFWIWHDAAWMMIYHAAVLWLLLPVLSLVISYVSTIESGPKKWKWLLPLIFGASVALVEYLTYSMDGIIEEGEVGLPSFALIIIGGLASLFGFTFAKNDRKEREKAERLEKKKAEKTGKKDAEQPKNQPRPDDYNPGADFIPDADDTWADQVLAEEGYGDAKVDYAESDPDFSIDTPDEACERKEEPSDELPYEDVADLEESGVDEAAETAEDDMPCDDGEAWEAPADEPQEDLRQVEDSDESVDDKDDCSETDDAADETEKEAEAPSEDAEADDGISESDVASDEK